MWNDGNVIIVPFRYVYVYFDHRQMTSKKMDNQTLDCFQPTLVHLERTGTIKVVTISALVSHFLPYFNSSVNPIIYNIMSGSFDSSFVRYDL